MPERKITLIDATIDQLYSRLKSCDICPRNCRLNRLKGKIGYCGGGKETRVFSAFLHKGEEPPISGQKGSGTVFFSGCSLKCVYCQNYKFSCSISGETVSETQLSGIFLKLQKKGAHNINLVTPTHFLPQILMALKIALKNGLNVPIVYNTSGYEKVEIIKRLKGIVDVYLSDLKYTDKAVSRAYSNAPEYPDFAQESIKEIYGQAKALMAENLLKKGLIIRHLVLPNNIEGSKKILAWIADNLPKAMVSVMFQYQPYYRADKYPQINRPLTKAEYQQIRDFTESLRLKGFLQGFSPAECLAGINFTPNLKEYL
ncbi:MAG: radical SAM protein [Candidatus Omnitrophica bacterium]|nr:radical SAM protein [Candidatus Omnitrophota bacterium]MDD5429732.1 radical SAM protein [Candidatus Omnitrophota bacterium]